MYYLTSRISIGKAMKLTLRDDSFTFPEHQYAMGDAEKLVDS